MSFHFTDAEYADPVETLKRLCNDLHLDIEVISNDSMEISRHGQILAEERFLP